MEVGESKVGVRLQGQICHLGSLSEKEGCESGYFKGVLT